MHIRGENNIDCAVGGVGDELVGVVVVGIVPIAVGGLGIDSDG